MKQNDFYKLNKDDTYQMYKRQLLTLAENAFEFKNMILNKQLLINGSIAIF